MLIYLIAGEPSGDMLGARLMRALKEKDSNITFKGVGGDNMQKEGMDSLFDITDLAIMGLVEVIPSIPKVLRHIKNTVEDIKNQKPDIVITIDSWSFSARIHKALRRQNIKVLQLHYVAPQVWAWKKRRAKTMYKYIDHLLTLFPNEPQYFTPYNLPTTFVGHPVIESSMLNINTKGFKEKYNISEEKQIVLLLPGSRHNEVANLLPTFLETAKTLQQENPNLYFIIPTVKTVENRVKDILKNSSLDVLVLNTQKERYQAAQLAKLAIAASGTVALELAIINVPHLVAYKVPAITAWVARHFTNIKYVNLTNILLDTPIVPELLQDDCSITKLTETAKLLLDTTSSLYQKEIASFEDLRKTLGLGVLNPSQKASEIIFNLIKNG
ncbi:MAG: lipid-A-disaccharide synthase [Alphaproteobacteria bacterium]|nr:lipid-A-disaccharide synthase [Alphaproteobacteria bacterium]